MREQDVVNLRLGQHVSSTTDRAPRQIKEVFAPG